MARMSTAPDLTKTDGLKPLERAARHPLMLGLFIPLQQGAWSPSTWTRSTSWSFEYNAECTVRAEELGFDLVFGLAQWLRKGGERGGLRVPDNSTRPPPVTTPPSSPSPQPTPSLPTSPPPPPPPLPTPHP